MHVFTNAETRKKRGCMLRRTNGNFLKIGNPDARSHKLGSADSISISAIHADRIERDKSAIGQLKTTFVTPRVNVRQCNFQSMSGRVPHFLRHATSSWPYVRVCVCILGGIVDEDRLLKKIRSEICFLHCGAEYASIFLIKFFQ